MKRFFALLLTLVLVFSLLPVFPAQATEQPTAIPTEAAYAEVDAIFDRIDAAERYLRSHPDTVAILSGGQGTDEDISEAECMYRQLTARGISPQQLWIEDKATSTWENLKFSLDLIEEKTGNRPDTIGVISSEYHLFRAGLFAKDCGVTAVGIPAKTQWISLRVNYFLREVAGVWHYLILGGQYHD